jgi:hypothetical protein
MSMQATHHHIAGHNAANVGKDRSAAPFIQGYV